MLLNLHIKNIALIDDMDIGFEDGLNILTGETGAGKSIIIGSLGICLGERFNKDLLRNPEIMLEPDYKVISAKIASEQKRCKEWLSMSVKS